MGWFDEQIRQRKQADNEAFEDAFLNIAGMVMGRRLSAALNNERQAARNALDEILRYYHAKSQEVPDNIKNFEEEMEFLCRPYGLMRRTVYLSKHWHKDAVGAMLATRKDDHSVTALIPNGFSGYDYLDNKTGKRVRVTDATEELFDEEAVAFYKPLPLEKISIKGLMKYIAENISVSDIAMFGLASLAVALVGLLSPWLNEQLFSDVILSGSGQVLLAVFIFMICASVSGLLFGVIRELLMIRITTKLNLNVEAAGMMRVLSLPADFFKKYSSGELSNRVQYLQIFCNQIVSIVMTTGLASVFSLVYIVQIAGFAPALVVPSLVVVLATFLISVIAILMQIRISREQMELASKEQGMSYALISGIQKIRLSGAEKRIFANWGNLYAKESNLLYNPPLFLKINSVITMAITMIGTIVMYYLAVRSHVSVSEYYAFNTAYGMVSGAFTTLAGVTLSVAQIKPILEMVKPILDAEPEIAQDKEVVTRLSGGIELNNVTFRYDENMPPVLDNLSLKIRSGQYVAIVGSTGCGKSTLMRIMLGFEKPQKGAVYYDGKDLNRIDLKSLRRKIGVVMQNGRLFNGDIYSNIVISAPELTIDDAWEAADLAGMKEDIENMPMGMYTILSEGMGGISGGQRQRLMIARAIAPKPKILMFDEATSALDNVTQKKVSESLDKLKCTRIVIAHRLSTIRQCDRIVVLDKGHIIEDGNYDELIAQNGFFAELVARQRLDEPGFVGKSTAY